MKYSSVNASKLFCINWICRNKKKIPPKKKPQQQKFNPLKQEIELDYDGSGIKQFNFLVGF